MSDIDADKVNELAQFIRQVNGNNRMGAAQMAEKIIEWQAARQAPASGEAEPVGDFRAEIRTERDSSDEYVSFLTFVVNGKSNPYLYIPETLDQEVLEEALSRLNAHPPAKVPDGWSVRRVDDRITVQHPDFGGYCADLNADDKSQIAPVILYHLAEALLTAPTPATKVITGPERATKTELRRAWLFLDGLNLDDCNEVKTLRKLLASPTPATTTETPGYLCQWHSDGAGCWMGSCGKEFWFEDGGPSDNGMKYCLNCGKPCDEVGNPDEEDGSHE